MNAAASDHARPLARGLGAATLGLAVGALLLGRTGPPAAVQRRRPAAPPPRDRHGADTIDAADAAPQARRLYEAAALLAASVLSDSALEHYRGGFENPGMFAPLASAAVVLACALHGARGARKASVRLPPGAMRLRDAADNAPEPVRPNDKDTFPKQSFPRRRGPESCTHHGHARALATRLREGDDAEDGRTRSFMLADMPYATACAVGTAGLGFHAYNVLRRPGGLSWGNLFYAAPLGAPAALALAGVVGLAARPIARGAPLLAGLPSGRALCGLAAFGIAGTSAEAALLHFRGAFQHPAMWLPVSLPPAAALLLARAAVSDDARPPRLAHLLLRACTWLGVIGVGFHTRGVACQMGGWRNWSQNLLAGPPLPAPPSFSALALAGRAGLALRAAQAGNPRRAA